MSTLTITTIEEAKEFVYGHAYNKDMQVREKALYLLDAKDNMDTQNEIQIASDILLESQSINAVKSLVNKNFGRYGVDELRFLYDEIELRECIRAMLEAELKIWREHLTWDYVLGSFNGNYKYSPQAFTNMFLAPRLKHAYSEWFANIAKKYFPDLNSQTIGEYVKLRKQTDYVATFKTHTNTEFVELCKKNGHKVSWKTVNRLRTRFGYTPESEVTAFSNLPLWEQPAWKREHGAELRFWKDTHANEITEDAANKALSDIQQVCEYSDSDIAVIRNWLNRARYEGVPGTDGIRITDTLRRRYKDTGTSGRHRNSDAQILNRIRLEIRTRMRDGQLEASLPIQVIGRPFCRGNAELRTCAV